MEVVTAGWKAGQDRTHLLGYHETSVHLIDWAKMRDSLLVSSCPNTANYCSFA